MVAEGSTLNLHVNSVDHDPSREGQGGAPLLFRTNQGDIRAAYHEAPNAHAGVVWVWGADGGLEGPAEGIYARLADQLTAQGLTSIRVDYRHPRALMDSVGDTLVGVRYLKGKGLTRLALVGHSFGGAVVITAGVLSQEVKAVVALSSQTSGTQAVGALSPRALLLVHGEADTRLPPQISRTIYLWAKEPKELVLYPGAGHGLRQCRAELDALLTRWLTEKLQAA